MRIVQMRNHTMSQMMGFIVVTDDGYVIAIDGGTNGDADAFYKLVTHACAELMKPPEIDCWLLTHPHNDHHDVFRAILANPKMLTISCVAYSPLSDEWSDNEPYFKDNLLDLNKDMRSTSIPKHILQKGETLSFGKLDIDVLGVANPDITDNAFNNSSCVFRFREKRDNKPDFVWIVLGDLGVEAGLRLLDEYGDELRADAVQMAHHGQNGVTREVYEAIAPRYAFWTTPDWLWTNTPPDAAVEGSGPWKTLEVRKWLEEIGAQAIRPTDDELLFDTSHEICIPLGYSLL